jgi:ribonucleotide reductase alpha subunit
MIRENIWVDMRNFMQLQYDFTILFILETSKTISRVYKLDYIPNCNKFVLYVEKNTEYHKTISRDPAFKIKKDCSETIMNDLFTNKNLLACFRYEAEGRYRKKVKAQKLWFAILDSQIETGTPYMMYKDACNRKSNQKVRCLLNSKFPIITIF